MKQSMTKDNFDLINKIEAIEKEVRILKLAVLKKAPSPSRKIIKLKGLFKGTKFADIGIKRTQKSLYSRVEL